MDILQYSCKFSTVAKRFVFMHFKNPSFCSPHNAPDPHHTTLLLFPICSITILQHWQKLLRQLMSNNLAFTAGNRRPIFFDKLHVIAFFGRRSQKEWPKIRVNRRSLIRMSGFFFNLHKKIRNSTLNSKFQPIAQRRRSYTKRNSIVSKRAFD